MVQVSTEMLQQLIAALNESFEVEVKSWIDPSSDEGRAKIIKSCIALRNLGGGFLVIGFEDSTFQPGLAGRPENVRMVFQQDDIQRLVASNVSERFEVTLYFVGRDGQEYPVIAVERGVKTPVFSTRSISIISPRDGRSREILKANTIYVRTLESNHTVSTAELRHGSDFSRLMDTCFDNREADIGRFLRRHLSNRSNLDAIASFFQPAQGLNPPLSDEERDRACLDHIGSFVSECADKFTRLIRERAAEYASYGVWHVGFSICGEFPQQNATREFLSLLMANNPRASGWPLWIDSRGFREEADHPRVIDDTWEAFLYGTIPSITAEPKIHLDFWKISPQGLFYHGRVFQDDLHFRLERKVLDFGIVIFRVAEAILVGLRFARAFGCDPQNTRLAYIMRWTNLSERELSSWANPNRMLGGTYRSHQDIVESQFFVPLDTPDSAIYQYVRMACAPLFRSFDGFDLPEPIYDELVREMQEWRLSS